MTPKIFITSAFVYVAFKKYVPAKAGENKILYSGTPTGYKNWDEEYQYDCLDANVDGSKLYQNQDEGWEILTGDVSVSLFETPEGLVLKSSHALWDPKDNLPVERYHNIKEFTLETKRQLIKQILNKSKDLLLGDSRGIYLVLPDQFK